MLWSTLWCFLMLINSSTALFSGSHVIARSKKILHRGQILTLLEKQWSSENVNHISNSAPVDYWATVNFPPLFLLLLNPRPGRGGGCPPPPGPEVFLRCTLNYEADRAEILRSLWGILCVTFGKTYGSLEGDIEASFDYFRSKLTLWHSHHIL